MIVNPVLTRKAVVGHRPGLLLLVDGSASMELPGENGRTRSDEVRDILAEDGVQKALAAFEVTQAQFVEGLVAQPGETAGHETDLGLALRQAAETFSRAEQVIVISDGAETRGDMVRAVSETALRRVSAVGVGSVQPPADLGPVMVQAPRVVRENEPFDLTVRVGATGMTGKATTEVLSDGKVAKAANVALGRETGKATVRMPGLPAGFHVLTAKTAVRAGEATAANNQRSVMVEARRDKTKVLFVAGAPSPDYAAVKRVVERLPRTEVDFWVRVTKGEYLHQAGGRVTKEALDLARALKGRQVVVLMDVEAGAWGSALERFVLDGGTLGVLAGKRTGAGLSGILPAGVGAYREVPVGLGAPAGETGLGQELLRATGARWWAGAPYLAGQVATTGIRPGTEVVLRGNGGIPLLLTRTVGQGRTLLFAGDGTHRWVLSAEADEQSKRLHEIFWQTVVRWLGSPRGERQVLLMMDPPVAQYGQPVRALVQVSRGLEAATGARVTVLVKGKGSEQKLVAGPTAVAGRYQAAPADLAAGEYTVRAEAAGLGSDEKRLVVEPGGAEVAKLTLQEGRLRALAQAAGGEYARLGELGQLLERLPRDEVRAREVVTTRPLRTWVWFLVVLGLCTAEWVLRRRWGW
ncbi:MAG: hypothetical protein ABFE07_16465 [Armatimonadia bacterium]